MDCNFLIGEAKNISDGYMLMKSCWDHMWVFVLLLCCTALGQRDRVRHMSLPDHYRFVLNMFDVEGALLGKEPRHFLDPISNKGSTVDNQCLRQSGTARYLSTSQLLMHNLAKNAGRMMYGIWCANLGVWIVWMLALCDLNECRSRSL